MTSFSKFSDALLAFTYASAISNFERFCLSVNILSPFPITELHWRLKLLDWSFKVKVSRLKYYWTVVTQKFYSIVSCLNKAYQYYLVSFFVLLFVFHIYYPFFILLRYPLNASFLFISCSNVTLPSPILLRKVIESINSLKPVSVLEL